MSNTRGPVQFDRYVEALGALFDPDQHMGVDRLFEFVCCLIRAGGIEDQGWDPILESTALIDDLSRLSTEPLDPQKYAHPERTRARLALLSYCHVMKGMCCNFPKAARERLVESAGLRLMPPPRTSC